MATGSGLSNFTESVKLFEQFPFLLLTGEDFNRYPQFTNLLSNLTGYITSELLTVQTSKDLQQAEEILRHEKHSWLLNHILYLEVQELLLDYEIKSLEVSLSSRDQQFHKILQECLTLAELEDYLDFSPDPSSKVTTLGLTKEDLNRQNPYKKHMSSLQQALIPEIEERLRKKCENLVLAHDPENSAGSTKLMFAKSSQLPALVETDKDHLERARQSLKEEQRKKDKQFTAYYQTLMDSMNLLETLISTYKLQKQPEHDAIAAKYWSTKCDVLCLKINLVELQILCDTYTVKTQQSLSIIRKHLDDAVKDREKEKLNRIQAIKAYESVGDGFDKIVAEYGILKQELENKQWGLAELDKSGTVDKK